jgi:hypothetical protein
VANAQQSKRNSSTAQRNSVAERTRKKNRAAPLGMTDLNDLDWRLPRSFAKTISNFTCVCLLLGLGADLGADYFAADDDFDAAIFLASGGGGVVGDGHAFT